MRESLVSLIRKHNLIYRFGFCCYLSFHQIPIRTFVEWDEDQPGFADIDLVAHDGGLALGDFCQTLER